MVLDGNGDNKDNMGGCRPSEAHVALRPLSLLSVLS